MGTPGDPYDFAVGGMYCFNRAMLNKARRWIGSVNRPTFIIPEIYKFIGIGNANLRFQSL